MRFEAVLLDMGGVLIPEDPSYERTAGDPIVIAGLRALGIDDPRSLIPDAARRVKSAYRALAAECAQPDLDAELSDVPAPARELLLRAFGREAAKPPHSYARSVVATLARSWALGLVSNTVIPGDHHARSLSRAGILEHLGAAAWSANHGRRKPDPAMIHDVLARLGVAPRNALLVGDKIRTDILAACRAGVRSVWLKSGSAPDTGEARPDFVIQDLRQLPGLLALLGKTP
jgi:FMN phosphatase YigB (HAD superfamily)